jgi:2-polyprenyl-3-methyl-5-hydroxy-6-metoxy-1,4-benzoquinol methylase
LNLFTTLYPNALNPNQKQTSRHVGYLSRVEPISESTYNLILANHPGIVDRMRDELSIALGNDPVLPSALNEFNQAVITRELFNCIFLRRNRRNPPRDGKNYDYVNIPRGPQKHLPTNFQLTEIPQSIIDELENNERIPQVSGKTASSQTMSQPHDNSAKYYDFVFERRFGNMYNVLTQNNLSKIRALISHGKILDFGSGTGRISIPLAQENYEVTAVDCSSQMLEELKRKAQVLGLEIQANETITDVISNYFDLAIAIFTVLSYIITESDLRALFKNIFKSLKPGGLFMFDLENRDGYYEIFRRRNGIVHNNTFDFVKVTFHDNDPNLCEYYENVKGTTLNGQSFDYTERFMIRFWTLNEVRSIFNEIGFIEMETFNFANAQYLILKKNSL